MAIREHTPPPSPPHGGSDGELNWRPEIDHRRGLIALYVTCGQSRHANLCASLWLSPDVAEKVGNALIDAVTALRGAQ